MMFNLICAAASCKDEKLMGKYLAKAEMKLGDIPDKEVCAEIEVNKSSVSVIKVKGRNSWLRLYVVPKSSEAKECRRDNTDKQNMGKFSEGEKIVFSSLMIDNYLKCSGDTNIIHTGEHPVVPGLMILDEILPHSNIEVYARFYIPVYADEKLWIKREEKCITVYSERGIAVKINMRRLY